MIRLVAAIMETQHNLWQIKTLYIRKVVEHHAERTMEKYCIVLVFVGHLQGFLAAEEF